MAKPTKIVVHFDDGTTQDIPADGVGSIFLNEPAAVKCGHKPPYGKPPHTSDTTMATAFSTSTSGSGSGGGGNASTQGTSCYLIQGIIVCP
jgi:hypothetical protein